MGRIISFEPGMLSYAILGVNVAMNGYGNVTLVNKAVADKSGTAPFYLCRTGDSDDRLIDISTPNDKGDAIMCDVVSVNEYLANTKVYYNRRGSSREFFTLYTLIRV